MKRDLSLSVEARRKRDAKLARVHLRQVARADQRRKEAEARQEERDKRSTAHQLWLLNRRPGKSVQERARLKAHGDKR